MVLEANWCVFTDFKTPQVRVTGAKEYLKFHPNLTTIVSISNNVHNSSGNIRVCFFFLINGFITYIIGSHQNQIYFHYQ